MDRRLEKIDIWEDYHTSNKGRSDKLIRVAFYARVSTEHEAQVNALENQENWCLDLLRMNSNWQMTEMYVDKGITGTQAKRRVGFLKAIEDGKNNCYELLVVRDVSRFARNCEESLRYAHLLKKHNVEVYFYNDGIWSMDPDGDLRLGLMSILAQDESRRISEKVHTGQHISRQKGVLYGTGNILGYRLVRGACSADNTYEIIEEDADTVRMIFDLYVNRGMGIKKISSEMIARHRKNASGEVKWDAGKISRILDNRTYSGYIGYKKSRCTSFLEHTRVKTDKSEHIYIKGNFPAIVDDSLWQKAQQIKDKNTIKVQGMMRRGKKPQKEKWVKKLRCSCGATYKRFKWRTNDSTGEEVYGYQCNNQVLHRKRSYIEKQGLDGTGYCDVRSIAMWKLDFQLKLILQRIWKNPDRTVENLITNIEENFIAVSEKEAKPETGQLIREQNRLELRLKNLTDMRIDGEIDKDTYAVKKKEITERLSEITKELSQITGENKLSGELEDKKAVIVKIREALEETADIDGKFIDESLIDEVVERVVPYEDFTFKWYLNIGVEPSFEFSENDYIKYLDFDVGFDEAREYRKRFQNFLRRSQWKDIHTEVYLRL